MHEPQAAVGAICFTSNPRPQSIITAPQNDCPSKCVCVCACVRACVHAYALQDFYKSASSLWLTWLVWLQPDISPHRQTELQPAVDSIFRDIHFNLCPSFFAGDLSYFRSWNSLHYLSLFLL